MNAYYFTFRSVTAAMQGNRVLERAGIPAVLSRSPKALQQQGCGYCLRLGERHFFGAKDALLQAEADFIKIYLKTQRGQWQEVTA